MAAKKKAKAEDMRGLRLKDEDGLILSVGTHGKTVDVKTYADNGTAELSVEDATRLFRWLMRWLETKGVVD